MFQYMWPALIKLGMIMNLSLAMWKDPDLDEDDEMGSGAWDYNVHGKDWS